MCIKGVNSNVNICEKVQLRYLVIKAFTITELSWISWGKGAIHDTFHNYDVQTSQSNQLVLANDHTLLSRNFKKNSKTNVQVSHYKITTEI